MGFDKNKIMRSAERYLTQGKISAAIREYKTILKNDPSDVNTQNMLGDLFSKAKDNEAAVKYYGLVAEHYDSQGFVKKAIAVYNKIYRIKPDAHEVSASLANLYKKRGSFKEALRHYEKVAEYHEEKDEREKALKIWEQIAEIATDNTGIYLKIADFYWQNEQQDKALKAFIEGAERLVACEKLEEAIAVYSQALQIESVNPAAVKGFVKAQIDLGYPEEAVKILNEVFESDPSNKEIVFLLVDCYLDLEDPAEAEKVIFDYITNDPTQYSKLLDLVDYHFEKNDLESAVRILSMIAEQVLVSQKPERLINLLQEVLTRDPENISALRLQVRYYSWHKDDFEFERTLQQMADASNINESVEDERFALSQLIMLNPGDIEITNRLRVLADGQKTDESSEAEAADDEVSSEAISVESEEVSINGRELEADGGFVAIYDGEVSVEESEEESLLQTEEVSVKTDVDLEQDEEVKTLETESNDIEEVQLAEADEAEIEEQVNSVKFYIEQGYEDLAEQTLAELRSRFGNRGEFSEVRKMLGKADENSEADVVEIEAEDIQIDKNNAEEPAELEAADLDAEIEVAESEVSEMPSSDEVVDEAVEEDIAIEAKSVDYAETNVQEEPESEEDHTLETISQEVKETTDSEEVLEQEEKEISVENEEEELILAEHEDSDDSKDDFELELQEDEDDSATAESENSNEQLLEMSFVEEDAVTDDENEKDVLSLDDNSEQTVEESVELEEEIDQSLVVDKENEMALEQDENESMPVSEPAVDFDANEFDDPDIEVSEHVSDEAVEAKSEDTQEEASEPEVPSESDESVSTRNEVSEIDDSDYETHYHHAVAYQEMGLLDDAIREFQNAVDCTKPNDGTGRFLQCCTLLGHCFIEKRLPKLAATWFNRAFEVESLGEQERQALDYELGNVYELNGDKEKARVQFEKIYAVDLAYRDIGERLAKYTN